MAIKNYYALLEIDPAAPGDEVKRVFRAQIARYHPDKVQHLGREFQSLAAERAAELTEAYRVLSDQGRRAEYDRAFAQAGGPATPETPLRTPDHASQEDVPPPPAPPASKPREGRQGARFTEERATRDEYVRKATVERLRQALAALGGGYEASMLRGFDVALAPKRQIFGRNTKPRLLARFLTDVDRQAVADAWTQASTWAKGDEVCVLLLGTSLAPAGELAGEITAQRRKSRGAKITVIPVDARVWDAHMPLDAPGVARTLLARLKDGT